MADNMLSMLFEINADPGHAGAVIKLFEEQIAASLGVSEKSFHQFNLAAVEAGKDLLYIGAGAVGLGGALFAAAEKAAHLAEAVGHVAEKTGATVEEVSTLKFAADRVGVSFEAVDHGLTFLARNLGQVAEGSGKNAKKALEDLGISAMDAHGRAIPLRALLPQIVEHLGNMEAGSRRTTDSMALFGRGGAEVIPVLNSMRQGFQQVEDRARSLGLLLGDEDVRAGRIFLAEQRQLTAQMSALALTVGREVMPVITQLFIRLEHYPLLLEQLSLQLQKLEAYLLALPSGLTSLAALPLINKRIADSSREMDQAITASLVKLDAEVRAALAAGVALGDGGAAGGKHVGSGKSLATGAREATLAIRGLAEAIPTLTVPITSQLIPPLAQLAPAFQVVTEAAKTFADVSVEAAERSTEAEKRAVAQHAVGLLAAIANRRVAAGVEMVWESAQGFSALGRYDYWGAAQHFLSAAEYGVLAGRSGGRSGGAGAAGSARTGPGTRESGFGPQTLAPGAPGSGGRFGGTLHVVVVGEAQAGEWLAGTLNRAVDRGVTLTATSSQRGSPVGH